jgi:N-acyl-D-amino-acid deacylase
MLDIVLKSGEIVDGTGSLKFNADVAVKNGLIVKVGQVRENSKQTIGVEGLIVAPGFIDSHSHSDLYLIHEPQSKAKIMQGITTEIIGQDGLGEAPIKLSLVNEWRKYLSGLNGDPPIEWTWSSMKEYLDKVKDARPAVNVASLVGHGNLRLMSMGMEDREPTKEELGKMKKLLAESLEHGAIGLSTGLIYAPCVYSKASELVELCNVVASFGGVFVVHMRNEGDRLLESIEEVLMIARESGVHVHISHFKSSGKANWGKSAQSLEQIEKAQKLGINVSFDQYPYTAGSTFLSSLLPSWVHEGGVLKLLKRLMNPQIREKINEEYVSRVGSERFEGWERVLVTYVVSEANKQFEGLPLGEIAKIRGEHEIDTLINLVIEESNQASMVSFTMSEDDIRRIMAHTLGSICTDGLLLGKPHPRAYGAFPRVLGPYVREGVLSLEEAIRKMTSFPAQIFNLRKRGRLEAGYFADITVFDPKIVTDKSTFVDPKEHPEGIEYVIVNGVVTVKKGEYIGNRSGRIILAS